MIVELTTASIDLPPGENTCERFPFVGHFSELPVYQVNLSTILDYSSAAAAQKPESFTPPTEGWRNMATNGEALTGDGRPDQHAWGTADYQLVLQRNSSDTPVLIQNRPVQPALSRTLLSGAA